MQRLVTMLLVVFLWCADAPGAESLNSQTEDGIQWFEIRQLGLEGQAFEDVAAPYDRLPSRAEGVVRDAVWNLSRNSAGLCVRFVTDATTIHARWTLVSSRLAMPHMAATGVSGLDLYAKTDDGRWHWLAVGQPRQFPTNTARLAAGIRPGRREYLLYLPLYNSVSSVEIGVPEESTFERAAAYPAGRDKPIVFYGTSITHGACASRPGMVHTAIIGRKLHRPIVNLGYSGNGRMEAEVGQFLSEIDAAVFVIDCLPNMQAPEVAARTGPLIAQLRGAHPTTPIVLVEDRFYTDGFLIDAKRQRNLDSQAALKQAFDKLLVAGDENLYYIAAGNLLGKDGDGAVDSSHPNDLGFMRQADAFLEVIEPIVNGH